MKLNENNIQAPFQYKISDKTFELKTVSGGFSLNTDNVQIKVFSGERLFCADIGYAVDGAVEEMEFLIDSIKVYPQVLESLEDLQAVEIKDNEVYLIKNELDFKSIVFFPPSDLNKKFDFTITTYSSTFSAFMFDEIAKKLNSLDTNYPIKNYYENTDYKINDIIKYNGYLYRVFKDFTSDSTDYYLKSNCNILTPFKKLELDSIYKANELVEYNNNFFIVQKDFVYQKSFGVLTNLNGLLKPLQDIIIWFDGITKIYKNQIVIKDSILYKVLEDIDNPIWDSIQQKIETLIKADNTFYDDSNSSFGNNTNTVQKAIEKLKSNKQDSLIAGNNINLYGNAISVEGGVNKEYELGSLYIINDLIIKDNKIYKVNESFTASNWNADISKCILISTGGGNGASEAIDVSFDNTNAKLQQLAGYDFPRFKVSIPDTINLTFKDEILGNGAVSSASIVKENNEYRLKGNITAEIRNSEDFPFSFTIDNITNDYEQYSTISQFFNFTDDYSFSSEYISADSGEITIAGVDKEYQFKFVYSNSYSSKCKLYIETKDGSDINGTYTISLNIKNRVLKPEDRNIFGVNSNFQQSIIASLCNLGLNQTGSSVKLQGTFTSSIYNVGTSDGLFFYSPIIENYFNLSDGINLTNTTGITSSTGKACKFGITKISDTPADNISKYVLSLAYQDGSSINQGDVFTFNLTPDKNSSLNTIYQNVTNVQQMGEALNYKILDLAIRYMIPAYYTQYANASGVFDANEAPSVWYKKMYGITTTWQIMFNSESVYFRTEGSLASSGRSNGIQGDAGRNASGKFAGAISSSDVSGIYAEYLKIVNQFNAIGGASKIIYDSYLSRAYTTANEFRVINRLIRVYKLLTINGKTVSQIMEEYKNDICYI